MALDPLATTADLQDRGIDTDDDTLVGALLDSASAAVREAAGSPISQITSTIVVDGGRQSWLDFPVPLTAVTEVQINSVDVEGWKLRRGRLWRGSGWYAGYGNDIAVTGTFGYEEVPADIVDLVCSLVAAGLALAVDGYNPKRGLTSMSIDDYREGYSQGDDEIISPFDLPERTRVWLRQRFGGGVYVTGYY